MRPSILQNFYSAKSKHVPAKEKQNFRSIHQKLSELGESGPQILTEETEVIVEEESPVEGGEPRAKPINRGDVPQGKKPLFKEGKVIGFWAIPTGGGEFVKLAIRDKYTIENKFIDRTKLSPVYQQRPIPVWPIIANMGRLSAYKDFKWVKDLLGPSPKKFLQERPPLFDPEHSDHLRDAQTIQQQVMSEGWAFVMIPNRTKTITVGCSGMMEHLPYFKALHGELIGTSAAAPITLSLDTSSATGVRQVNAYGQIIKKRFSIEDFRNMSHASAFGLVVDDVLEAGSIKELTKGSWRTDTAAYLELFRVADDMGVADKVRGKLELLAPDMEDEEQEALFDAIKLFDDSLNESIELMEMTFNQLWGLTQKNGSYKIGGMRKITSPKTGKSIWTYDVSVPGRTANGSRFVVTRPPKAMVASDGNPQVVYNFKSRTDRSTTGMRQKGYVKFMFKTKKGQQSTSSFRSEWNRNVHVFCTCPDFKFRWHKVLFDNDASHQPKGGFEANNAPPLKTNPSMKVCMCKHLVAVSKYLSMSKRDLKKYFDEIEQIKQSGLRPQPGQATAPALTPATKPNVTVL